MVGLSVKSLEAEIESACSFDCLDDALKQSGKGVNTRKKLIEYVEKARHSAYAKRRKRILAQTLPERISGLPSRSVSLGGIEFRLHGVVHACAGIKLSDRVKTYVNTAIKSYLNPPYEDYLFEEGFDQQFSLDSSKSMKDIEIIFNTLNYGDKLKLVVKDSLSTVMLMMAYFMLKRVGSDTDKCICKAVNDERYLPLLQELYDNVSMLPVRLQIEALKDKPSHASSVFDLERSRMMARVLAHRAVSNNIKVMHGIMGLSHVNQVAYFLAKADQHIYGHKI
jgi:hypothetical protein